MLHTVQLYAASFSIGQLHVGHTDLQWMYLRIPLAVRSQICLAVFCSLFLLQASFLASAEESVTKTARQLCVASTTGSPEGFPLRLVVSPSFGLDAVSCSAFAGYPWMSSLPFPGSRVGVLHFGPVGLLWPLSNCGFCKPRCLCPTFS